MMCKSRYRIHGNRDSRETKGFKLHLASPRHVATTTNSLGAGCAPVTILMSMCIAFHEAKKKRRHAARTARPTAGFEPFLGFSSAYHGFVGIPAFLFGSDRDSTALPLHWPHES